MRAFLRFLKNLILLGIIVALVGGLVIWYKNYKQGDSGKKQENNNEVTVENLENYKEKYHSAKLEDLPEDYKAEQAIKDGVVLITNSKEIYNKSNLDDFVINTSIRKADERITSSVRIGMFTTEGDLILTDVFYDRESDVYTIRKDATRDKLGLETEITEESVSGKLYVTILSEDTDHYTLSIARTESVYWEPGEIEKAKDYEICTYQKDLLVEESCNSFYGKVIDCDLERMIVEVAKNAGETKSLYVYFTENNDMLYQKDTYVQVRYNGMIEDEAIHDIVSIRTIEDKFELIFKQDEFNLNNEEDTNKSKEINKLISKEETDKYDFDIYTYGGEVSVFIDNEIIGLRDALLNGRITVDEIMTKAKSDYDNKKIEREGVYMDGGSTEYTYTNYKILKLNTLGEIQEGEESTGGNKDLYIGSLDLNINDIDKQSNN